MEIPKPQHKRRKKIKRKSQRKIGKVICVKLAKKITRCKTDKCEKCGKFCTGKGKHAAHIIPVDFGHTAADLRNLLVLCAHCHVFGNAACHNSPIHFEQWLSGYAPGLKEILLQEANRTDKIEWSLIYENLLVEARQKGVKP